MEIFGSDFGSFQWRWFRSWRATHEIFTHLDSKKLYFETHLNRLQMFQFVKITHDENENFWIPFRLIFSWNGVWEISPPFGFEKCLILRPISIDWKSFKSYKRSMMKMKIFGSHFGWFSTWRMANGKFFPHLGSKNVVFWDPSQSIANVLNRENIPIMKWKFSGPISGPISGHGAWISLGNGKCCILRATPFDWKQCDSLTENLQS